MTIIDQIAAALREKALSGDLFRCDHCGSVFLRPAHPDCLYRERNDG